MADSSSAVALLELADGSEDPRPAITEFGRFLEQLKDWVDGPPVIEQLESGHTTCSEPTARSPPFDRSGLHKRRAKGISPAPAAEHTKRRCGDRGALRLTQHNDTT
jgi:hypothetical protein